MSACIYQITNQINGKSYIGFTTRQNQRINEHKRGRYSSTYLTRSIKHYGWEDFTYKILYIGQDEYHTLNIIEPFFIKYHNTKYPNGYNLTSGGEGSPNHIKSIKSKRKISLSMMKNTNGFKSGKDNINYKKHRSSEIKNKISKTMKGKSPWNKGVAGYHHKVALPI